ncbi:hypothetical protein CXB51_014898 [Gossypium anomalum]|uniref:Acid phosphatase 1 n=1 Tax=Gossypium anomalum TaxID=47600 RepID=A0A8J6D531_9ROSI|nr:hypothetical protein CXB51_014898 [Gossypium anomalum]
MASQPLTFLFLLLVTASVLESSASYEPNIRLPTTATIVPRSDIDDDLYCASWQLAVETNNAGSWATIPSRCVPFVRDYMTGQRYASDCEVVANYSLAYASTVQIASDGKDAWVFDVDETLLTNLPYYRDHGFGINGIEKTHTQICLGLEGFGVVLLITFDTSLCKNTSMLSCDECRSEIFNESCWDEWVAEAKAPAIPSSLKLYNGLKQMGFKIFVLTGRSEHQRNDTRKNLELAGYTGWEGLILRGASDGGTPATIFKSERRSVLVNEGYRIHGNSGDQWSDLLGFAVAKRSFKLPNPINAPQTRGCAEGILRQLNPPPGVTKHSGCGLCMSLPGKQFNEKSNPPFLNDNFEHSWLNPEKKLYATLKFIRLPKEQTKSGSTPDSLLCAKFRTSMSLRQDTVWDVPTESVVSQVDHRSWGITQILRKFTFKLVVVEEDSIKSSGTGPEKLLNLRSNDERSLKVSGTVPENLLLLRWRIEISVRTESSLTRVPCRLAWLRSMPATNVVSFDTEGLDGVGPLLIPPPIQTPAPPPPALPILMPTPPPPTVIAACVGIICQRIKARSHNIPIFSPYVEDKKGGCCCAELMNMMRCLANIHGHAYSVRQARAFYRLNAINKLCKTDRTNFGHHFQVWAQTNQHTRPDSYVK